MKKRIIKVFGLMLLLTATACIVAPAPGYYPGPYREHVEGGGYYYHHGYGYYR